VLSCTAPSDYVTFFVGKPGARATDGNKFELYVLDAENKALYDTKQGFRCGYANCGEPRTVWSAYVPTDRSASAVFVVIKCLGGSLLNSNCDIELNLALSAARSNLVPIAPGTVENVLRQHVRHHRRRRHVWRLLRRLQQQHQRRAAGRHRFSVPQPVPRHRHRHRHAHARARSRSSHHAGTDHCLSAILRQGRSHCVR
jgi:hypothetical protein